MQELSICRLSNHAGRLVGESFRIAEPAGLVEDDQVKRRSNRLPTVLQPPVSHTLAICGIGQFEQLEEGLSVQQLHDVLRIQTGLRIFLKPIRLTRSICSGVVGIAALPPQAVRASLTLPGVFSFVICILGW